MTIPRMLENRLAMDEPIEPKLKQHCTGYNTFEVTVVDEVVVQLGKRSEPDNKNGQTTRLDEAMSPSVALKTRHHPRALVVMIMLKS